MQPGCVYWWLEDEQRLAAGLRKGRDAEGFAVDVIMPGANGYQVCGTLRSEGNWTPRASTA
jgi:two-component system, OmpR family, response regulator